MEKKQANEAALMYPWDRAWMRRKARVLRMLRPVEGEKHDQ